MSYSNRARTESDVCCLHNQILLKQHGLQAPSFTAIDRGMPRAASRSANFGHGGSRGLVTQRQT
jgi:hypothetical protein